MHSSPRFNLLWRRRSAGCFMAFLLHPRSAGSGSGTVLPGAGSCRSLAGCTPVQARVLHEFQSSSVLVGPGGFAGGAGAAAAARGQQGRGGCAGRAPIWCAGCALLLASPAWEVCRGGCVRTTPRLACGWVPGSRSGDGDLVSGSLLPSGIDYLSQSVSSAVAKQTGLF